MRIDRPVSVQRDISHRIAVGGLSEIFLARERGPAGVNRTVVVKRMRDDLPDPGEAAEMFADEARMLALLEHPHIVRLYAASFDGEPELVLEHLDGPSLKDVIDATRGAIDLADVLDVGVAIAEALHFAHTRTDARQRPLAVVHRDITPRNVIVTSAGVVKVLDFGIAKARSNVYETATGVVRGTPRYMAPEQVLGGSDPDARIDIYALGLVLFELASGVHPLGDARGAALHDSILVHGVPHLAHVQPHADPALAALVHRATRRSPDDRPRTMADVVDALASMRARCPEPRTFQRLRALAQRAR